MSINCVTLSGNLTKDPELRKTQSNKDVCSFTIATNEGKDKTEFHNCVAWEKTAEIISQYSRKGQKLAVQGRLQTRKWEKDGVDRYSTEIIVFQVDLPSKSSQEAPQGGQTPQQTPQHTARTVDSMEDEIPF